MIFCIMGSRIKILMIKQFKPVKIRCASFLTGTRARKTQKLFCQVIRKEYT